MKEQFSFEARLRSLEKLIGLAAFKFKNRGKQGYECPLCGYYGAFQEISTKIGPRMHAKCPDCGSLERHRLQYLVINSVIRERPASAMRMLHFAPEPNLGQYLSSMFTTYETADLNMPGVQHHVNLLDLPFADSSYDCVLASHVLEHVTDDGKAISEVRRVLSPGGIAILPVPMVSKHTVEYPYPNIHEYGHVRACGNDYFERYRKYFTKVNLYASDMFPEKYQLFIYEDRSGFPTVELPFRELVRGEKHVDIVPVCFV